MTRHFIFLLVISCATFLGLSGCAQGLNPHAHPNKTAAGAAMGAGGGAIAGSLVGAGAIFGAAVGGVAGGLIGYDQYLREPEIVRLQDALRYEQVQIVILGDELTLIIPANQLFYPSSPRLNANANRVLGHVTEYLQYFMKVDVNVAAYTDNTGWEKRNIALSKQRAKNVARYLWTHGMDARLLTATGYGSADPISNNATSAGRAKNQRIEITLRRVY
ncbi:MAG: OmpA family protein [Proteobacteria bacterium]|nr:OmpA family protein [Pseudomonadota bacterium]